MRASRILRSTGFCLAAIEALPPPDHAGCSTSQLIWQAHTAAVVTSDTSFLLSLILSYNPLLLSTYNEL